MDNFRSGGWDLGVNFELVGFDFMGVLANLVIVGWIFMGSDGFSWLEMEGCGVFRC